MMGDSMTAETSYEYITLTSDQKMSVLLDRIQQLEKLHFMSSLDYADALAAGDKAAAESSNSNIKSMETQLGAAKAQLEALGGPIEAS